RYGLHSQSISEVDVPSLAEQIEGLTSTLCAKLVFLLQIRDQRGRVYRRADLERRRSGDDLSGDGPHADTFEMCVKQARREVRHVEHRGVAFKTCQRDENLSHLSLLVVNVPLFGRT